MKSRKGLHDEWVPLDIKFKGVVFIMSMIDPSIDYLAEKVGSKYGLVIMAAKRARQLVDHAPALVETKSNKPVSIALEEIAQGLVTADIKPESTK
jgi:DNA-directed RNA polymerase subunit omega